MPAPVHLQFSKVAHQTGRQIGRVERESEGALYGQEADDVSNVQHLNLPMQTGWGEASVDGVGEGPGAGGFKPLAH